jgi:probable addiction module antidote protein
MSTFIDFKETLMEDLRDPDYARIYISTALEEYKTDSKAFLLALKDVADARGGLTKLARKINLNRENLYKVFSSRGNPRLSKIETVLHGLGFRLDVHPFVEQRS